MHFAGRTAHPDRAWVTQQARQLTWTLQDRPPNVKPIRFLIYDRDTKFTRSFNTLFLSEGIEIVLTPYRASKANAFAECWIRPLRELPGCLTYFFARIESFSHTGVYPHFLHRSPHCVIFRLPKLYPA